MSTVNLEDAKVSYEGQTLPAMRLISKLQAQLQETTCRLANIASTLGDLHAALLNSETIEVKLTLSREDLGRLRALGGVDDGERVRKAVMNLIHPQGAGTLPDEVEPRSAGSAGETGTVASPPHGFPPTAGEMTNPPPSRQPLATVDRAPVNHPTTTLCPTCQSPIGLPGVQEDQPSVEIRCGSCGAKSLVKYRAAAKSDKAGPSPTEDSQYRKLFETLSR